MRSSRQTYAVASPSEDVTAPARAHTHTPRPFRRHMRPEEHPWSVQCRASASTEMQSSRKVLNRRLAQAGWLDEATAPKPTTTHRIRPPRRAPSLEAARRAEEACAACFALASCACMCQCVPSAQPVEASSVALVEPLRAAAAAPAIRVRLGPSSSCCGSFSCTEMGRLDHRGGSCEPAWSFSASERSSCCCTFEEHRHPTSNPEQSTPHASTFSVCRSSQITEQCAPCAQHGGSACAWRRIAQLRVHPTHARRAVEKGISEHLCQHGRLESNRSRTLLRQRDRCFARAAEIALKECRCPGQVTEGRPGDVRSCVGS
jgi:hypothetical protein